METGARRMLGEILLERGVLSRAQLHLGLVHHHQTRVPLGLALVREHVCSEADVLTALSEQLGVPWVDLEREPLDPALTRLIPARLARQHRVVPLRLEREDKEVLHVALPAPASVVAIDDVRAASGKPRVVPHLASEVGLAHALRELYGLDAQPEPPAPELARASEAPVLLYGWPAVTAVLISRKLARHGYAARVATPLEVLHSRPSDLVLAPLQAMEGLLVGELRIQGSIVVHAPPDDASVERAQALGAKGLLAHPTDEELLLRAIGRVRPPG
ncbi:general secretion pathway protein GspE [Aggregicoccus sp. 17bor-14]|uniref:GspE/PulE/PilB domain-containing protein n=1 Tax=Myxococcaceae TaxID=31 RepID=UPI00129C85F3|nr:MULTISPECIES: general secretion pathway protein GspE [Myxococcaceae]MBF5043769.1 general secretion pathway protein GspE [Simulacricoccus sp. 17bor-14]MRI89523.1 general secretion pathway protein GspE [Aggregicoccus sp. 17bor-14]